MIELAPDQWLSAHAAAAADGFMMFDFLTGVDRGEHVEIVSRVVNPDTADAVLHLVRIDDRIASLSSVYQGAIWHERETREMFGVDFEGLVDDRPLLLREPIDVPPLRKSVLLTERAARPWPGAGGGRRTQPLGVPDGAGR